MLAKAVSKGVLSIGAWTLAKILASAVASPFLARLLGAHGYGQYSYFIAFIMLASLLGNVGMAQALTKTLSERSTQYRSRVAFAALVNGLGMLAVGALTVLILRNEGSEPGHPTVFLGVLIGAIFFDQVFCFSRGILYGVHREELAGLPAAIGATVGPAASVGLAWMGFGLLGAMAGFLAGNLLTGLLSLACAGVVLNSQQNESGAESSRAPGTGMLSFGIGSMLFAVLSMVLYRTDIILIRNLLKDDVQTGLYATASQLTQTVWVIPIAVEGVMLQTTARLWSDHNLDTLNAVVSRLMRYTALAAALFLILLFVLAEPVLRLYFGPDFVQAAPALRILVPGVFSYSLARILWPVIQARGSVRPLVAVIGGTALLNVILNWFFIESWGTVGAAAATSISFGGVVFFYVSIIARHGVWPCEGAVALRLCALTVVTALLTWAVTLAVSGAVAQVLLGCLAGAAAFAVGTLWSGLLSVDEMLQIVESMPNLLRKPGLRVFAVTQPWLRKVATGFSRSR